MAQDVREIGGLPENAVVGAPPATADARPPRSSRQHVRNPVLTLPAAKRLQALDSASREALRAVLKDLAVDARARAEQSWRAHKGFMAAYWKTVSVYAGHLARALRDPS